MDIQIPDFSKARVLVVGDLMLDRYWHGEVRRISPEAPVPIMKVGGVEERPGGAGNVALNLAALGAKVKLIGLVGHDPAADILECSLTNKSVDCYLERIVNMPTITKLRVMSQHQQLIRLDFEDHFKTSHVVSLLPKVKAALKQADVMILSDYGKGTVADPQQFIQLAKQAKVPVFIDPKNLDFSVYCGATVVTPNLKEFESVVGHCESDEQMAKKAHALMTKNHFDFLLVTRGADGMSLFRDGDETYHIPTRAQEVFDVTGAGDTAIATLAAAFSVGCDMRHSVMLANAAAGISVGKLGAATVSMPELRRALYGFHQGGIMAETQLKIAVEDAKAHGEKVVMTNGCFDILHAGHVHYLKQAKQLGDRLVVAVNDDASVRKLKGKGRPINMVEHRMTVLAGLSSVDWVVAFSEETPERLICHILPDVLVKGGDWRPEQIAGSQCVLDNGGEVHSLDFIEGHSTTSMIDRIVK